nr:hypothetical protein Itr_chr13CG17060 [Ipomoea trifida]
MGGGTVPSTTYTQTDIHGTGATANEHVSSVCTTLPTESGSGTDISMQQANVEGLVVCDQKRRRVEPESPFMEPIFSNPESFDFADNPKNLPMEGPVD